SWRRDAPEFQLNACVDVHRLGQRHTELVAAVAPGAADVGHCLDEPLMADDLRMIRAGKDARTAGVIRVRMGVDDPNHRRSEMVSERGSNGTGGYRVGGGVDDDR